MPQFSKIFLNRVKTYMKFSRTLGYKPHKTDKILSANTRSKSKDTGIMLMEIAPVPLMLTWNRYLNIYDQYIYFRRTKSKNLMASILILIFIPKAGI